MRIQQVNGRCPCRRCQGTSTQQQDAAYEQARMPAWSLIAKIRAFLAKKLAG
jgi:hypothetical protein